LGEEKDVGDFHELLVEVEEEKTVDLIPREWWVSIRDSRGAEGRHEKGSAARAVHLLARFNLVVHELFIHLLLLHWIRRRRKMDTAWNLQVRRDGSSLYASSRKA